VSAKLRRAWKVNLGGRLSSPVAAQGNLFVAQIDTHTVHALNAENGRGIWSYTAGGRVDSPPTVSRGRVYFGSADGRVYCLRARDGALAWRFLAAPTDQRIVSYGQLESAWPVHGAVLVRDGAVYCAAGRSSYLDGGIRLVRLDASSGRMLSETILDHRDATTGVQPKGQVKGTNMPGALPDILSSDGESVFMRHTRFDLQGQLQPSEVPHLFNAAGFLESAWWHRTYTMIGTIMTTNYGGWPQVGSRVPAGRLLAVDGDTVYGFGRNQYIHHGAHVGIDGATVFHFRPDRDTPRRFTHYQAFGIKRQPEPDPQAKSKSSGRTRRLASPPKKYEWTVQLPVLARAMLLARDTLFFGGPPDIFESDDPHEAWEGKKGGSILALSAVDGRELGRLTLDSPPAFDAMAAAYGRLYLATVDGKVHCLQGR
jgi:outer membrane protein assembly factor BamB